MARSGRSARILIYQDFDQHLTPNLAHSPYKSIPKLVQIASTHDCPARQSCLDAFCITCWGGFRVWIDEFRGQILVNILINQDPNTPTSANGASSGFNIGLNRLPSERVLFVCLFVYFFPAWGLVWSGFCLKWITCRISWCLRVVSYWRHCRCVCVSVCGVKRPINHSWSTTICL